MKKFRKFIRIGFVTFFSSLFKHSFALFDTQYTHYWGKIKDLMRVYAIVLICGFILITLSGDIMSAYVTKIVFTSVITLLVVTLLYNMYFFAKIWYKQFKEHWDKEI
jgi:hypothetical protein